MVAWKAEDMLGLTPGVDPRRTDKFFALGGQNYVFDSIGPKSIFGNRYLTPYPLGRPEHVQGFRLKLRGGDRVYTFTADAILEWREDLKNWRVVYVTPTTSPQPYRWTWGYLNQKVYFCHPTTGILIYDVQTEVCLPLVGDGVPQAAIAICVNNGRLCAIDIDFFYFSESSDGQGWSPTLGGAGFFRISDRVSGLPIILTSYTKGVLVWTTGGVMQATFTADEVVYRFRAINTEYRPINSFCTCRVDDDTVIILDERGLFQSRGELPTPFSPLFNEFLIKYIQVNQLSIGQNIRLEWDELKRLLYVSVSLSIESPKYEMAFVLYPPMDKWGQFNEEHYGILPFRVGTGSRADSYYGFVDSTARCRIWRGIGSRETLPGANGLNSHAVATQKPTHVVANGTATVLSSSARLNTIPSTGLTGVAGYYGWDGGTNVAPTITGLSAAIRLGLLRFEGDASDQLSEVTKITIGNVTVGDTATQMGVFDLTPLITGEQLGLQEQNYMNHGLRLIATIDGVSQFDSCIPELVDTQRGARYYSCSVLGLWHMVELTATEVGEAFHLQSVDLTAVNGGKIQ